MYNLVSCSSEHGQRASQSPPPVQSWVESCLNALCSLCKERLERLHHEGRIMQKQWYKEIAERCRKAAIKKTAQSISLLMEGKINLFPSMAHSHPCFLFLIPIDRQIVDSWKKEGRI